MSEPKACVKPAAHAGLVTVGGASECGGVCVCVYGVRVLGSPGQRLSWAGSDESHGSVLTDRSLSIPPLRLWSNLSKWSGHAHPRAVFAVIAGGVRWPTCSLFTLLGDRWGKCLSSGPGSELWVEARSDGAAANCWKKREAVTFILAKQTFRQAVSTCL